MNRRRQWVVALTMALAMLAAGVVQAAPRVTTAAGDWTNTATWVDGATLGVPGAGDDVVLNHIVTNDVTTPELASFSNNTTLVFLGTNTALRATTVTVNGTITHPAQTATTTNELGEWIPDHRVWIVCSNLTVNAGKSIDANSKGYAGGGHVGYNEGRGPGGGKLTSSSRGCGASYGGVGSPGDKGTVSDDTYGVADAPVDPGSGGGGISTKPGGYGGGYVRIAATGHLLVKGSITANGGNGSSDSGGGGSGGGIFITCRTFGGTNVISATGGNGTSYGGVGGGGRIALVYNAAAQEALGVRPEVVFSAGHGTSGKYSSEAGLGTVYLSDASGLPAPMINCNGIFSFSDPDPQWRVNALTVDGGKVVLPESLSLVVTNDLRVTSAGRLDIESAAVDVGGELACDNGQLHYWYPASNPTNLSVGAGLLIANSGACYLYAAATNSSGFEHGGELDLGDHDLTIVSNGVLYPVSNPTNGGSMLFKAGNITIGTNAQINADFAGFSGGVSGHRTGYGPGGGGTTSIRGGGGGHGGAGGTGNGGAPGGVTNDVEVAPYLPGSGGGSRIDGGGRGGGYVGIVAAARVRVNGAITANGKAGSGDSDGGGAGGGVFVTCRRFEGDGSVSAIGGNGSSYGGGGGGGRIAVWAAQTNAWSGALDLTKVAGGNAGGQSGTTAGGTGTVYWKLLPATGTVIMFH